MNKTMVWVLILTLSMLTMTSVAVSRPYPGGPRSVVLSSDPIPCHVYLKAKHSIETQPNYIPASFFQAQVQYLRMEPDLFRMEVREKFIQGANEFLQRELDSLDVQKHPEHAERLAYKLKMSKEAPPPDYKAPVVRVVETLEGASPGEEILLSGLDSKLAPKKTYYVLGYQDRDLRVHPVSFLRTPQEVREEKTVMGTFKKWVRWLLSECDNV